MARSLLVAIRTVAALVLAVGLLLVAAGVASEFVLACDPGYSYHATAVDADGLEGEPVAFENLTAPQQEAVLSAFDDSTERVDSESDLPADFSDLTVNYRGDAYRVSAGHVDCANPFAILVVAGTPLAVIGGLGAGFAHLALRRRE